MTKIEQVICNGYEHCTLTRCNHRFSHELSGGCREDDCTEANGKVVCISCHISTATPPPDTELREKIDNIEFEIIKKIASGQPIPRHYLSDAILQILKDTGYERRVE